MVFIDEVEEILGEVKIYLGYFNTAFKAIQWNSDSLTLTIEYYETSKSLSILSYTLHRSLTFTVATAQNFNTYSRFRMSSGIAGKVTLDLEFREVPDIFKNKDAILSFITDIRDYGFEAFTKYINKILSENV